MRLLRIGNSNDEAGSVPTEQRGWQIASRLLAESSGEEVETVLKRAWPNPAFPALIARWMEEIRPDVVMFQVNNFWYGHESVPLWFERKFGRAGIALTNMGLKVGKQRWFADSRAYITLNRGLARILPSATHFTVPQVAACMEASMRKILAHEGVILVVRGNDHWAKLPMATRRANDRNIARNNAMSSAMRNICEQLRVPYIERPTVQASEIGAVLDAARWHQSAEGERQSGELDGAAMLSAWKAVHG